MRATISTVHTVFTAAEATALAAEFNADEFEDWTYVVRVDPKGSGNAVIDIYDENGELAGKL